MPCTSGTIPPRLIYITGIDGSGKTTLSRRLAETFRRKGYTVELLWLRFNHLLSKPLLLFCRMVGLTRYETVHGYRLGYHDFHRSRTVSWLFVILQYLDAHLAYHRKLKPSLRKPRHVTILDRYVIDILVDLMVDTRMFHLYRTPVAKAFLRLIPPDARIVVLFRSAPRVLEARPDFRFDERFSIRQDLYRRMVDHYGFPCLRNDRSLEEVSAELERMVGVQR